MAPNPSAVVTIVQTGANTATFIGAGVASNCMTTLVISGNTAYASPSNQQCTANGATATYTSFVFTLLDGEGPSGDDGGALDGGVSDGGVSDGGGYGVDSGVDFDAGEAGAGTPRLDWRTTSQTVVGTVTCSGSFDFTLVKVQ